jgi:hypothetical protein
MPVVSDAGMCGRNFSRLIGEHVEIISICSSVAVVVSHVFIKDRRTTSRCVPLAQRDLSTWRNATAPVK